HSWGRPPQGRQAAALLQGQQQTEHKGQQQRPVVQVLLRAEYLRITFSGFQFIQQGVNTLQFVAVAGAEVAAAGQAGNIAQGFLIHIPGWVNGAAAKEAGYFHGLGTKANGVNTDMVLRSQSGGFLRFQRAGVVGAIGNQHNNAAVLWLLLQAFDAQANGVTNGGFLPGQTNLG